jgi:hypothetical protein
MFLTALMLSVVAAYYSIAGLTAIFAAAVMPVIIMGATLELGKVVATVWLHNNWKRINWFYKSYLIPAILFLMLLTSMGIFGFLSKAHSDQSLVSGDSMAKVAIYDEKIATEKANIDSARKALSQMDAQVDQMLGRTDTDRGAERAVTIRKQQARERVSLQQEISKSQKNIIQLNEDRAPLAAEFRKIEAEVGPIKYIAAFIYGDNPDASVLEKAVTWVIILIVVVFDPLALCLILAANKQMEWIKEDREKKYRSMVEEHPKVIDPEPEVAEVEEEVIDPPEDLPKASWPFPGFDEKPLDSEQYASNNVNTVIDPIVVQEIVEHCPKCNTELQIAPGIGPFCPNKDCDVIDNIDGTEVETKIVETPKPMKNRWPMTYPEEGLREGFTILPEVTEPVVEEVAQPVIEETPDAEGVTKESFRRLQGDYVEFEGKRMHTDALKELHPEFFMNAQKVNFGTAFPEYSAISDIFVRIDSMPHRVYKFNGAKWIDIGRDNSDTYLTNTNYLQHLVEKISTGEIDPDILTEVEMDSIQAHINNG